MILYLECMIDAANERLLTTKQAAEQLQCSRDAVRRYMRIGCRGKRLEWVQIGGRYLTSREAIGRFAEQPSQATDTQLAGNKTTKQLAAAHGIEI